MRQERIAIPKDRSKWRQLAHSIPKSPDAWWLKGTSRVNDCNCITQKDTQPSQTSSEGYIFLLLFATVMFLYIWGKTILDQTRLSTNVYGTPQSISEPLALGNFFWPHVFVLHDLFSQSEEIISCVRKKKIREVSWRRVVRSSVVLYPSTYSRTQFQSS